MTKKACLTFCSFLIVSNSAWAEDNALYLSKGSLAPRDGILLTVDYANQVRIKLLERDSFVISLDLMKKNEVIYKTEIEQLSTQNTNLVQAVKDEKTSKLIGEILYFSLGAVLSGLTVYVLRPNR